MEERERADGRRQNQAQPCLHAHPDRRRRRRRRRRPSPGARVMHARSDLI